MLMMDIAIYGHKGPHAILEHFKDSAEYPDTQQKNRFISDTFVPLPSASRGRD